MEYKEGNNNTKKISRLLPKQSRLICVVCSIPIYFKDCCDKTIPTKISESISKTHQVTVLPSRLSLLSKTQFSQEHCCFLCFSGHVDDEAEIRQGYLDGFSHLIFAAVFGVRFNSGDKVFA